MGEEPEAKVHSRGARSAGDQGLREALRPGRPSVHALELHRSGLDSRETARRVSQRLQRKSRQGGLPGFQNMNDFSIRAIVRSLSHALLWLQFLLKSFSARAVAGFLSLLTEDSRWVSRR